MNESYPPPQPSGWAAWQSPSGGDWEPPPPPRRHRLRIVLALVSVAMVMLTLTGAGIGYLVWQESKSFLGARSDDTPANAPAAPAAPAPGRQLDAAAIAGKVDPAVVNINTTLGYQGAQAAGTGIVLTSSGEVLTNNHVIAGATGITVTDVDDGHSYSATVAGYDRGDDIAVLRLRGASGLPTVSIGDSSKVRVGDPVVAIGNAGGTGGTPSVAAGAVTALDQSIRATDPGSGNSEQLTGLIQVDANVQPGDSGGPLANGAGQVIGVDTAATAGFRFSAAGHAGYAIPISQAITISKQILAGKASSVVHIGPTAFLGVGLGAQGGSDGQGPGGSGTTVTTVVPNSPAAQAGLAPGDVIVALDGHGVDSASTLTTLLGGHRPGERVRLTWLDGSGHQRSANVQLIEGPAG